MKKQTLLLSLLINSFALFGQEINKKATFEQMLDSCHLKFDLPKNFIETPIKKNKNLIYQYAIKHKKYDYEIRYSIFPLYKMIEMKKDSSIVMANPNIMYSTLLMANIMNLSGNTGKKYPVQNFDANAVKKEYNADKGGLVAFELNSEYGKGYEKCFMYFLHKDNIADIYITYLFNNYVEKECNEVLLESGYALKFK